MPYGDDGLDELLTDIFEARTEGLGFRLVSIRLRKLTGAAHQEGRGGRAAPSDRRRRHAARMIPEATAAQSVGFSVGFGVMMPSPFDRNFPIRGAADLDRSS